MTDPRSDFVGAQKPITSVDLDEVERLFGFTFPSDIRGHYLAINGGSPRKSLFDSGGIIRVVNNVLPIKYGREDYRFEDVYRDLKVDRGILPEHLVAFADDPGGDFYCFSIREQDSGSIWLYVGEYSDDPERAVEFLASSLTEFLAGMTEDKG